MSRKNTPSDVQTNVLLLSARRCALCYHLYGDLTVKHGQIAHIDQDPNNNRADNLAFLCLPHHSEYDSKTSQHKNFTASELKKIRDSLYWAIENKEHHDQLSFKESTKHEQQVRPSDDLDSLMQRVLDLTQHLEPILRNAANIAFEMGDAETESWIKLELNGYMDVLTDNLPYYRRIYGELKSFNSIQGWRTVQFPDAITRERYSLAPIGTAIGSLERSLSGKKEDGGAFIYNHAPEAKQHLQSIIHYSEDVKLKIASESLALIVDSVRNRLYEWLLKVKRSNSNQKMPV